MKDKIIQNKMVLITLFGFFVTSVSYAQHHEEGHENEKENSHHHKHHIAVFNGAASNFTHHYTHYSIGLDYEYRFGNFLGAGIIGEYVAIEKGEFVGGLPVFMHFTRELKLVVAPLIINREEHHNHDHHDEETSRVTDSAFRLGASYSFHLGKFALSPSVNYDVGESNSLVYGLNIGLGF